MPAWPIKPINDVDKLIGRAMPVLMIDVYGIYPGIYECGTILRFVGTKLDIPEPLATSLRDSKQLIP